MESPSVIEGRRTDASGQDRDFIVQDWSGIWSGIIRYGDGSEEPMSLEIVMDSTEGWRVDGELFGDDEWIWVFEGNMLEGSTITCVMDAEGDASVGKRIAKRAHFEITGNHLQGWWGEGPCGAAEKPEEAYRVPVSKIYYFEMDREP